MKLKQQKYTLFINQYQLIIVNVEKNKSISENPNQTVYQILNGSYQGENTLIEILSKDATKTFNSIKKLFKPIKAGGGVVFNQKKELLLIKRNGLWDLPKGKNEKGEEISLTALREVHEECGISFLGLKKKLVTTYHAYFLKGKWILKKTNWYYMIAWGDEKLTPQLEESITEVKWVNKDFINSPKFKTYDSIKLVLSLVKW